MAVYCTAKIAAGGCCHASIPLYFYAMLGQPGLALGVVRHGALHAQPESRCVVRFVQVGDLMHHHVLGDVRGQQNRLPVEVQPVALTVRVPAVARSCTFTLAASTPRLQSRPCKRSCQSYRLRVVPVWLA